MRRFVAFIALSLSSCVEPGLPVEAADGGTDGGFYKCSPMTCTGCCSNNICRGGNELLACGYDGRACRECNGDVSCVSPGTCAGNPHDGGSAVRFNPDAGGLINPFTGGPLEPPMQKCIWIFNSYICG